MSLPKLVLEQTPEIERVDFLYRIIVDKAIYVHEEVFVYGATTMISAAGDLVIQTAAGQRVFGAAVGQWKGLYLVDPNTWEPVPELFPVYDDNET